MEKTSKNFRVKVMKYAHNLIKVANYTWSECLRKAWKLYKLASNMRKGVVEFFYQKTDGTTRHAFGTLQNLPAGVTNGGKRVTKPSYKTFCYFDTEKQSFRSFKVENFMVAI